MVEVVRQLILLGLHVAECEDSGFGCGGEVPSFNLMLATAPVRTTTCQPYPGWDDKSQLRS